MRRKQNLEVDAPKIGSNSNLSVEEKTKLASYIGEIERVEAEIKTANDERGELYASLKESGFDTKAVRHVVKVRKMDAYQRDAWENAIDTYMQALGMLADTPLGQAAINRELAAQQSA